MSKNIIALITEQFGGGLTTAVHGVTGMDAERADSTVRAAIPAMLATILGAVSSPAGKQAFEAALKRHDSSAPGDGPQLAAGDGHEVRVDSGLFAMKSLLGDDRLAKLSSAIGSYSGIGQGNGRSIIGLLAPAVLGVLSRQKRLGTNVDGIVGMLEQQRDTISSALPGGLEKSLRSSGLLDGFDDRARPAAHVEETERAATVETAVSAGRVTQGRRSSAARLLNLAGLAVVGALIWVLVRQLGDDSAEQEAQSVADSAGEIAAAPSFLVGGIDVADEFRSVADGLTRTLRGVSGDETAAAALPEVNTQSERLDRLTSIADRLPPEMKPELAGAVSQSATELQAEAERVGRLADISDEAREAISNVGTKVETFLGSLRNSARG